MAQPQGLNVSAIIVTAIVTIVLTGVVIEGVRAYYQHTEAEQTAEVWASVKKRPPDVLREQQQNVIKHETSIPIEVAMQRIVKSGGKLPSTQPGS